MKFPNVFLLSERDTPALENYIREAGWLLPREEVIETGRAGQGNMNFVLRVRTNQRTFILKQSRPWVEKYPHIAAPWDRALIEAAFYKTIQGCPSVAAGMPQLLGFDAQARILQLADLGDIRNCEFIYSGQSLDKCELTALKAYLSNLHSNFRAPDLQQVFANHDMRALNHQHIFRLPFNSENGLDLDAITPGLAAVARELQSDPAVQQCAEALGERYLGPGECLLHGDYFPGSWIPVPGGIRIIDPEFCFFGPPEFDWGVMMAHFELSQTTVDAPVRAHLDLNLTNSFAGIEIIRRLIGVAQLPLPYGLERKRSLLQRARTLLLGGG